MKIVLLNPPARNTRTGGLIIPPLGLGYIAASLRQVGYKVIIKDALAEKIGWTELSDFFRMESPDILGLSSMTPVLDTTIAAVQIARPFVSKIVVGGPHVSVRKQAIFRQCPEIDFGVVGEGEQTMVELVESLEAGRAPVAIPGVIGKNFIGPPRDLLADIDTIPFPARGLLPLEKYHYPFSKGKRVTTLFTSRGCPFHCVFCDKSVFGSRWRGRSASNVVQEVDEIVNLYKITSLIIYDDLFTLDKSRVSEFCEAILRRGYKLDWKCESRVNLVDPETLKLMKRAGCSMIAYGVESGNQHGLDFLNKKIKLEQIRHAFKLTHQAGIDTMAYFILGIPVETYEEELKTIKFAKEINPTYVQFSLLSPYYGTKLYKEAVAKGWYKEIDANNPIDQDLKRPVIISPPNWDEEKINKIVMKAYLFYYFRPIYIMQRLLSISSASHFYNSFKGMMTLIRWIMVKIINKRPREV